MWRDVGLGDWIYEVEPASGEDIAAGLLKIAENPGAARETDTPAAHPAIGRQCQNAGGTVDDPFGCGRRATPAAPEGSTYSRAL